MARAVKPQLTFESLFFSTPEQKLLRLLLSEPATLFAPRVICSRLKGVRGLGGAEGVLDILKEFERLGLIDFVSNQRAVRIREESSTVRTLKVLSAICNFETLKDALQPICSRGILVTAKVSSKAIREAEYDLVVVSEMPDEVRKTAARHPQGRSVEIVIFNPESYAELNLKDPDMHEKVGAGVVLWASTW